MLRPPGVKSATPCVAFAIITFPRTSLVLNITLDQLIIIEQARAAHLIPNPEVKCRLAKLVPRWGIASASLCNSSSHTMCDADSIPINFLPVNMKDANSVFGRNELCHESVLSEKALRTASGKWRLEHPCALRQAPSNRPHCEKQRKHLRN